MKDQLVAFCSKQLWEIKKSVERDLDTYYLSSHPELDCFNVTTLVAWRKFPIDQQLRGVNVALWTRSLQLNNDVSTLITDYSSKISPPSEADTEKREDLMKEGILEMS